MAATIKVGPINHVTNQSIRKTIFCPKWKLGKIVPLYKGKPADRLRPEAYRPITILPVVSKRVEIQV